MRADIFQDRKTVHFKISKEVHFALRSKLFKYNISMQELFDEFAKLVATDTPKGQSVIESIINRKITEATGRKVKKKKTPLGELDSETLYNMINGSGEK